MSLLSENNEDIAQTAEIPQTDAFIKLAVAVQIKCSPPAQQHHDKIDWDVAKRFLKVIYLEGPILRTNLAMKTGMNYTGCLKYISWMDEIGWVEVRAGQNDVSLSERGIEVFNRLKH